MAIELAMPKTIRMEQLMAADPKLAARVLRAVSHAVSVPAEEVSDTMKWLERIGDGGLPVTAAETRDLVPLARSAFRVFRKWMVESPRARATFRAVVASYADEVKVVSMPLVGLGCKICGRTDFKSEHALNVHQARAKGHKSAMRVAVKRRKSA